LKEGRTEHEHGGGRSAPGTAGEGAGALARDVARLAHEAAALEAAITAELEALDAAFAAAATAGDAPWAALAEGVLPLGREDPGASPAERRLAGLDRQRARLRREGNALAADARALRERGHDLGAGGDAAPGPVYVWRGQVLAWATEVLEQQRRMARRDGALAGNQRRRRGRAAE
jgi:hypothetical protein